MTYYVVDGRGQYMQECMPPAHVGDYRRLLMMFGEGELKYDISNIAFAQGEVARVNDNYGHDLLGDKGEHYLHQWKDICEDGNYDRVKRVLDQSVSEVEHLLARYSAFRIFDHVSLDNMLHRNKSEYVIELKIPSTFSDSNCWYIMRLIHEYMTCRVLEDWAGITLPEKLEFWTMKRTDAENRLKEARSNCGTHHRVVPSIL